MPQPLSATETPLVPEGRAAPSGIPADIFAAALRAVLDPRRLDMQALAAELGMGRATLYRRVGSREKLLGEVIWYLMRRAILRALDAGGGLGGVERIATVTRSLMLDVQAQPGLRRFIECEPECALRVLTSKHGVVQRRTIDVVERLLAEEEAAGAYELTLDRATLAYVIVRIGESFLYADAIADTEPDVEKAIAVIRALLEASTRARLRAA